MVKLINGCVVYDMANKIVPSASAPADLLAVHLNQTGGKNLHTKLYCWGIIGGGCGAAKQHKLIWGEGVVIDLELWHCVG